MKRFFWRLHQYLGLAVGIIFAFIAFTGAIMIFEDEIIASTKQELLFVEPNMQSPLPINTLVQKAELQLNKQLTPTRITISIDDDKAYIIAAEELGREVLYVNQYTGEVLGQVSPKAIIPFFLTVMKGHRWLFDDYTKTSIFWGRIIVGIITLISIILVAGGCYIVWPKTQKHWKTLTTIRQGKRVVFHDLHVSLGFMSTLGILILAITGLCWSFPWWRTGIHTLLGANNEVSEVREIPYNKPLSDSINWDKAIQLIQVDVPAYSLMTLSGQYIAVKSSSWGNYRAQDTYFFKEDHIEEVVYYSDLPRSSKINGWIYTLHVGKWGGLFSKIITFFIAIICGTLPLTGYYLWFRRKQRKTKL